MQKVLPLSSVTYECTHVTPSSALTPTTFRHTPAPSALTGMCSPAEKVLSTMYLGICRASVRDFACAMVRSLAVEARSGIGRQSPNWGLEPPIFASTPCPRAAARAGLRPNGADDRPT